MKCHSCVDKIKSNLKDIQGIDNVEVFFEKGTVLVETSLPSSLIKEKIEKGGNVAVLKGYGNQIEEAESSKVTTSAVAMVGGPVGYSSSQIQGVVRFIQANDDVCIVDGTIDGLSPGLHGLHIHECGDISQGCASVGDHFNLNGSNRHGGPEEDDNNRHTGDLGNIKADSSGRATFRLQDKFVKVWDIIGRSVVVTEDPDDLGKGSHSRSLIDGNSGTRLACGIISRAAGLFENTKKICACDGVTIWDERNKPLAGPGRRTVTDREGMTAKACSAS
uniref:Extracellular superoxide dismutase [Cu-Zn] n=2 Tax=Triatoma infestans TaxID=30076 RepID=A0A023F796_TRIIF